MEKVYTIKEVREQVKAWKKEGLSVGLVPTMGYLHEGHASLIQKAVEQNDKVVVSVFLNPTQFGPTEDLEAYPRDFEADCKLCESIGAALVFHPEPSEMYASDFCTWVDMDVLSKTLCGKSRPIHFRGVCTVVSKLFNIVTPDRAYFGQKDAQQLAIIRRMVRDLNMDIEIVGCPIVREEDGLAKSSRNTYLNEEERKAALILSKSVALGKKMVADGETSAAVVKEAMIKKIESEPMAKIDYVEAVDGLSMQPVEEIKAPALVAMAVYIGKTRLIDNFIVEEQLSLCVAKDFIRVYVRLFRRIHRATVTQAELDYVGSITVDEDLLDAAGIKEYQLVQIVDVNNGNRFETYTIAGERGSGVMCLNGAAARCVSVHDKIILMAYAQMTPEEAKENKPNVVFVDDENKISRVTNYEKHGRLFDMERLG